MKYAVVNVCDREIMKVGVADTLPGATEIMKNAFMGVFTEHYEEEDFENEVGCGDEWELCETEAWLNTNSDVNYDWQIIEIE